MGKIVAMGVLCVCLAGAGVGVLYFMKMESVPPTGPAAPPVAVPSPPAAALPGAVPPPPKPPLQAAEFQPAAAAAVGLTGAAYESERNRLLDFLGDNPDSLAALRGDEEDWRKKLLGEILAERIEKASAIDTFGRWRPAAGAPESTSERVKAAGEALAESAGEVPYVLAEGVWRSVRLKKWPRDNEEAAYLCKALGVLKFAPARQVLEEVLERDNHLARMEAAAALGHIADPRSVPPLVAVIERDPEGTDMASGQAAIAIAQCATRESIPFLREKGKLPYNRTLKLLTRALIPELEKKP